jgi:hypothetical protein
MGSYLAASNTIFLSLTDSLGGPRGRGYVLFIWYATSLCGRSLALPIGFGPTYLVRGDALVSLDRLLARVAPAPRVDPVLEPIDVPPLGPPVARKVREEYVVAVAVAVGVPIRRPRIRVHIAQLPQALCEHGVAACRGHTPKAPVPNQEVKDALPN